MPNKDYDSQYYSRRFRPALSSAEAMVPFLIERFSPSSVTDIGSAEGAWLSVFAKHGVKNIRGFDGPWVNKDELLIPIEQFTVLDLEIFKVPEDERFDLAMSLEVAEHLEEEAADNFVRQLTKISDRIFFSAAIPGQGGLHHLNERPPSYWTKKFKTYGFDQLDFLRPLFWDDERIEWWYRQNFFIYEKHENADSKTQSPLQEPTFGGAHIVHPAAFREKQIELDIDNASGGNLAKAFFRRLFRYINKKPPGK
jgi:hypothetical protein